MATTGSDSFLGKEETEEEFARRRGLRKGKGGEAFMQELREAGGELKREMPRVIKNLPDSHFMKPKNPYRRNRRVDFHKDHHKPLNTDRPVKYEDEEEEKKPVKRKPEIVLTKGVIIA